ncbi:MAG: glycosyltransferase [Blastocatellia bacterium]|nr:glycosyltransferase [Blastocatellia bacterium]
MKGKRLSVVVIGRNEGERLTRCLASLKAINFPSEQLEVIYVDSCSSDNSVEIATQFGATVVKLEPGHLTAAKGRNAGWRIASAAYILFLDGDTILDANFIDRAFKQMQDFNVAVLFGNRREIRPKDSIYNRVLDLDWISPPGSAEFCGGDALIRRSVLKTVGGYDETLIAGEEPDMCRRIRAKGFQILHIDSPMTGHDLAMKSLKQYLKRAFRTGYAYAKVSERFQATELPLWQSESRRNFRHASVFSTILFLSLTSSIFLHSFVPLIVFMGMFFALVVRTMLKFRWKTDSRITLLLYSIHSHLQQFPILIGQIGYWWDRRSNQMRGLVEYK